MTDDFKESIRDRAEEADEGGDEEDSEEDSILSELASDFGVEEEGLEEPDTTGTDLFSTSAVDELEETIDKGVNPPALSTYTIDADSRSPDPWYAPRPETDPLTLYRVGYPTIGEVWSARAFQQGRSTGGWGTGVYAFRDRPAAVQNEAQEKFLDGVYPLEAALQNPLQPGTRDAAWAINRLSRIMVLLADKVREGELTYAEAANKTNNLTLQYSLGTTASVGTGKGSFVGRVAQDALFETPGLQRRYGFDTDDFITDLLRATKEADSKRDDRKTLATQPINELLYPEFDGVAPVDGAGGNVGSIGCVIFIEKVEDCAGRSFGQKDRVNPNALRNCTEPASSPVNVPRFDLS